VLNGIDERKCDGQQCALHRVEASSASDQSSGLNDAFTVSLKSKANSSQGIVLPASEQGKATKRMQDGVLIIEKNGLKYNILGNVIR